MEFNEIKSLVYEEYIKNGYLMAWTVLVPVVGRDYQLLANLAEAGLIHTEVAELQEALRSGGDKSKVALECADIVIRVMNFCSRLGLDLEEAILEKNNVNLDREKLHGRVI